MESEEKSWFENMKSFLETDEGKESIERFKEKIEREEAHKERWIHRFKKWAEPDIDSALEKLINWYGSDRYVRREYSLGYEPREKLLWVALNYAETYCKECDDDKYLNMFTGDAYYIGSYVIQVMHGQGSAIRIDKIEGPIKPSVKERIISMIEETIRHEMDIHAKSKSIDWVKVASDKIYQNLEHFNNT